jgi:murein L,D-transpeptidase YafK
VKLIPIQLFRWFFLLFALYVFGCMAKTPLRFPPSLPSSPPPVVPPLRVDNEAVLLWASNEPAFIVVDKTCRTLNFYSYGKLVKSYPTVLGRQPGRKLYEGDRRTPSGLYMIIAKDHHRRWSRFMLLDYPTSHDVNRYWKNVSAGVVPKRGEGYPGVGGAIGIHGTDKEELNRVGINWTLGCVSLLNPDVQELYTLAPVGTLVYIKN